jgi:predicted dehydrogenase
VVKVAELLARGQLGRVLSVQAVRVGPRPVRIQNGSVAIDLATHDLDIFEHLLGRNITRVFAEGAGITHDSPQDMLSGVLRFGDDGPVGKLEVNWTAPEKRRELTLIGDGGMVRANYLTQDVVLTESAHDPLFGGSGNGSKLRLALRKHEPLRAELSAFAQCVLSGSREPVTAYDGARALAAALALRDSSARNRPVELLGMLPTPTA